MLIILAYELAQQARAHSHTHASHMRACSWPIFSLDRPGMWCCRGCMMLGATGVIYYCWGRQGHTEMWGGRREHMVPEIKQGQCFACALIPVLSPHPNLLFLNILMTLHHKQNHMCQNSQHRHMFDTSYRTGGSTHIRLKQAIKHTS